MGKPNRALHRALKNVAKIHDCIRLLRITERVVGLVELR